MSFQSHWQIKKMHDKKTYKDYSYLKIRYQITEEQFKNLIGFLTVILNEDVMKLSTMSPNYIIEKFRTYLGDPCKIIKEDRTEFGGIHQCLRTNFLEKYYKMWGHVDGWEFMLDSTIETENLIDDN